MATVQNYWWDNQGATTITSAAYRIGEQAQAIPQKIKMALMTSDCGHCAPTHHKMGVITSHARRLRGLEPAGLWSDLVRRQHGGSRDRCSPPPRSPAVRIKIPDPGVPYEPVC